MSIDTSNKFLVSVQSWHRQGETISVGAPGAVQYMTPDDALNLAAWLVAIAEREATRKFEDVLEAVRNT